MLKTLMAKAVKGDTRAATVLLNMAGKHLEDKHPSDGPPDIAAEDRAILEHFLRRHVQTSDQENADE